MTGLEAMEIVGKLITPACALAVTIMVFLYTRRRDKLSQLTFFNSQFQELSKIALSNDNNLECHYSMLFQDELEQPVQQKRKCFLTYMVLNVIESIWSARNIGLVERAYADRSIATAIESVVGDLTILNRCLLCYSDDFQVFIKSNLKEGDK